MLQPSPKETKGQMRSTCILQSSLFLFQNVNVMFHLIMMYVMKLPCLTTLQPLGGLVLPVALFSVGTAKTTVANVRNSNSFIVQYQF